MMTRPMSIHKTLILRVLRLHPEDLQQLLPGYEGSVDDAIQEIAKHPGEWVCGGELLTTEERDARLTVRMFSGSFSVL